MSHLNTTQKRFFFQSAINHAKTIWETGLRVPGIQ